MGLDDMTACGNEKWQTIFFKDEHFTADLCLIFMLVFLRTCISLNIKCMTLLNVLLVCLGLINTGRIQQHLAKS